MGMGRDVVLQLMGGNNVLQEIKSNGISRFRFQRDNMTETGRLTDGNCILYRYLQTNQQY